MTFRTRSGIDLADLSITKVSAILNAHRNIETARKKETFIVLFPNPSSSRQTKHRGCVQELYHNTFKLHVPANESVTRIRFNRTRSSSI